MKTQQEFIKFYNDCFRYAMIASKELKLNLSMEAAHSVQITEEGEIYCRFEGYSRGEWNDSIDLTAEELQLTEDQFRIKCQKLYQDRIEHDKKEKELQSKAEEEKERKLLEKLQKKYPQI